MATIYLDQVSFELKKKQNFLWLKKLGTVFCVFDQQDSGNISFGVQNGENKYFVKFAGAQTLSYEGNRQTAIDNLNRAVTVYRDLKHEAVINLVKTLKTDDGIALIFDWFEGECLFAHWTFDKWNRYTHPNSPYYKYRKLSLEKRLKSIQTIFRFLLFVEQQNYVAVDFYDGSILYDFDTDTTKICDIDFYRKKPTVNDSGVNFWGPKRFKSPEEYILGAPIDSITNVYTMGVLLFGLIGGESDRSIEKWDGPEELYELARKAIRPERELRFQSIREFYKEWEQAVAIFYSF
ncbi:hypothetical protein P22_2730 [Propionispora sp. 2/2-37]|uniref:protein kinase domain-containing protein n=1 Tax=Propionispora sp. 2/2-37 TaxID=1677858 RepID=UPI0006BB849A|nr:protein kinase [Propionispora sp. 2/2-37]CUH96640.1 hypothetical protein P22_2730 [Propionispora sp. 2/2-37]